MICSSPRREVGSVQAAKMLHRSSSSISAPTGIFLSTIFLFIIGAPHQASGCQFYPIGEYLKFVRVPENLSVGTEVLLLEAHPRKHFTFLPVDKEEDTRFFAYKEVNRTHVSIILSQSLDDLVDAETPRNLLKFRIVCDFSDGIDNIVSSHLSVTVYVEDINDHAPQFVDAPYHVTVDELTPTGVTIFRGIHAMDRDKPNTPNSDIYYAIISGNEQGKFSLESGHRTALILRKPLDYDRGDRQFNLVIAATDRGVPAKSTNTTVRISVLDNDDLDPMFTKDVYKAKIFESYPLQETAGIQRKINFTYPIHAVDHDREIDVPVRYDIISGNERGFFYLDPKNGSLFLKRPIDLDVERNLPSNTFVLQIHGSQVDNPLKVANARVEIEVIDLNDNLPEFEVDLYNISIVENLPNGFSVLQVIARDRDQNQNGEFDYALQDPSGAFSVDSQSGWLTVKDQTVLDREKRSSLSMKVLAIERTPSVVLLNGQPQNGSSVDVEITLLDANDNNPIFVPGNLYELVARSDSKVGTILGQVHAVDDDLGPNGMVKYRLQRTGNSSVRTPPFAVDEITGVITVMESPLLEGRHAIFVEAADQPANPSERRFSLAVVTIDVFRPNGEESWQPDFIGAPYEFWVGANVPVGTSVGQIRVNDAVKTSDLIYDLLHGYHDGVPFAVEERSGTITVVDQIEKFQRSTYDFEAVVTDERELHLITNVSIHVVDPSDRRSIFAKGTTTAPIVFHARENEPGALIGQVLSRNGTSSGQPSSFLIVNQQDVPDIAITEDGALYAPQGLDREARQNYSITVIAENSRRVAVFQVKVIVVDENDHAPQFSQPVYEGRIMENSAKGSEVMLTNRITATDDDDGDNRKFVLSLHGEDSEIFSIDQPTGRVYFEATGGRMLDREDRDRYDLIVRARDSGGLQSEATLKVIVDDANDNAPNFIRMIVLPDQGVRVVRDNTADSMTSSSEIERRGPVGDRDVPLLLVPENVTVGAPLIRLIAEDKDEAASGSINYILAEEAIGTSGGVRSGRPDGQTARRYFLMDSRSGEISVSQILPAEQDISLLVVAKDHGGLFDNITVRVHVVDVNDHPPVFEKSWYTFDIPEGNYVSHELGIIRATDSDFRDNANLTFELAGLDDRLKEAPYVFTISPQKGVLRVSGTLDRESTAVHRFAVIARDRGQPRLSSSVDIEVNILDVNDNPPMFFGYDDLAEDESGRRLPVYRASVPENSPIGSAVLKVSANDSDFAGNGNGLILFDLGQGAREKHYFTVDSKEGLVTTIANLDYEVAKTHRLMITASDLGSPVSLTSTALLEVTVLDVVDDETDNEILKSPTFKHRYYEVEVDENSTTPLLIATLDLAEGYRSDHIRFSIVAEGNDAREHFAIDPKNGSLYLITGIDRELRDRYEAKIRVDRLKTGRGMPVMIYPVVGERLNGLAPNEARVVVRVKDVNDNAPRFKSKGRPILAAIPTTAHYGYEVVKVEAEDFDEGLNGEIRYQILGREDAPRFAIDPLTGQVRSVASFARDAGRVFGFDVKATDRRGADNGKSSIANVFVYVLDDHKQLVMVVGKKPTYLEPKLDNITLTLRNLTGLDVRVRKLEPHIEKNLIDTDSTDVYLYAVDPHRNVMVDMETLQSVFNKKKMAIKRELDEYRVLEIAGSAPRRGNQRYLLSTLEVGVVVLGCVVFVGALVTALCVTCVRRNRRKRREKAVFSTGGPLGFALTDPSGTLQKPQLFPAFVTDGLRYDPEPMCTELPRRSNSICDHGGNCVRFHTLAGGVKHAVRATTGTKGLETSATSLHSSGQDSGIVARASCHCSHSSSPSSGESSNGYEDSLKSLRRRERHVDAMRTIPDSLSVGGHRGAAAAARRRQRFHSFTNIESMYAQEMMMQRDPRCCTEKRSRHGPHQHRRAHSEAENNITETVIHEHPRAEIHSSAIPTASGLRGKLIDESRIVLGSRKPSGKCKLSYF
ncbi:cadherin-89D [Prorops nasuta]|uniref:cadherin-89D n=1 Tax=Prorops nasuta TaxID=863751 RepID=UPI0034CD9846